ncbi:MAG: fatty acid cis/trans isomerase [Deltaproteobacteria bacterium]|nr:fatty acid cis/trans isomerase [Deltaproteobacteria bacterium]MBW2361583.1 fatty acid cis/trans isomerase [Deltaproteobacteria bacterium]
MAVYSSSRLRSQDPTRLFMDAQTTEEWRAKGFTSVVENTADRGFDNSILLALLEAKRRQPLPVGEYHAEAGPTCPATRRELGAFLGRHPDRGMPFGFPALPDHEYATIAGWLQQGRPGPTAEEQRALVTPSPGAARQIARWEAFLNRDDAKHALTGRYLYEHFFLAHVSFSDGAPGEFYELVRSTTTPGEPISVIATVRPTDDPGVEAIYYRFRRIHSTLVYKTHMVVEFGDERLARYQELFIEPEWVETQQGVALDDETGTNPFLVYAQIPPTSRYRFLLDDAEYFIRTFIRGPVCKGQVALNVIHDHFWVLFRDPDHDQTVLDPGFLVEQAPHLALPDERGSNERLIRTFSDAYRKRYKTFYDAKTALYERTTPQGFGLESLWQGRRARDAPMLTVYRHFDSASVHRGALGTLPRTIWVIDYSQFERIYYSLVAGFNVFGNLSHQVNVRRYMDFLRVEGELNFIEFLPPAHRLPTIRSWYLGDRAIENVTPEEVLSDLDSRIVYETDDPKRELIERVVDEHLLASAGIDFDPINYHRGDGEVPVMPTSFETHEDIRNGFRALTAPGTGFIEHQNSSNVNVIYVRIKDFEGSDRLFSIVINRWHDNVNAMFGEEKRLDPSKDTIDFLPMSIGSYPNYFFVVEGKDVPDLFDMLENFDGSQPYMDKLHKYGVNRSDPHFWETYDWFQQRLGEADPLHAGLYDLNRYYPLALER